jgi:hypothetical protein
LFSQNVIKKVGMVGAMWIPIHRVQLSKHFLEGKNNNNFTSG